MVKRTCHNAISSTFAKGHFPDGLGVRKYHLMGVEFGNAGAEHSPEKHIQGCTSLFLPNGHHWTVQEPIRSRSGGRWGHLPTKV